MNASENAVVCALIELASELCSQLDPLAKQLVKEGAVDCVYNPLHYAWEAHQAYLRLAGSGGAKTVLLGMNPGPHGMGQMGIPFAATTMVREVLGIQDIDVEQPQTPHPKRPVIGLEYPKEEVSGTRVWGLLSSHYGTAAEIFSKVFIVNHCPLMLFSGPRAKNITPDKVRGECMLEILSLCDTHLRKVVTVMSVEEVIGIGRFAERRARGVFETGSVRVSTCWHPSPASPLANRNGGADWRANVISVLPDPS